MHNMILGMSDSGKTLLAKLVCSSIHKKGVLTAVLDPLLDEQWECDFQTDNPAEFLAWAKKNKSAVLFVDEGSMSIGKYNVEMEWIVTMSRHWGHSAWIITQGATQLSPIVRDQTSQLFLFAVGESTMRIMGEHYREDLTQLPRLDKGEFYVVSKWEPPKKCKILLPGKRVPLHDLKISYNIVTSDNIPGEKDDEKLVENDSDSDSDSVNDSGVRTSQ